MSDRFRRDFMKGPALGDPVARLRWDRGIVAHPVHRYPPPTTEVACWGCYRGQGTVPACDIRDDMSGSFFWDGSADRHIIRDLQRAGWGTVFCNPDGTEAARVWGASVGMAPADPTSS